MANCRPMGKKNNAFVAPGGDHSDHFHIDIARKTGKLLTSWMEVVPLG
jgi:hypothetical protein